MKYKFKIYEIHNGKELLVASGEGKIKQDIEKEAIHYSMMYSQDCAIREWRNYSP